MAIEEQKLNARQKRFADLYLGECRLNGKAAAIAAGYSERTAAVIAAQNLTKLNIRRYLDDRLNSDVLTASEVLSMLSDFAKGSIADVLTDDGRFDYELATQRGTARLIKDLKIVERVNAKGQVVSRTFDIELHDAQAAAEKVGRFHKLFTDRREISGAIAIYPMSKEEWERHAELKIREAEAHLEKHYAK